MLTKEQQQNAQIEKLSSAFTISDMEVFLFPELMMALVLGNIMSPRIWQWKQDPWFQNLNNMTWNRKLQRLKQYIMDHYSFNLDLDTWGLTSKQKETARFSDFIDPEIFSRSNALFGYEGDKYYFDIDIRRHFGLNKYASDVIPYWKTETVEAMDAFRYKPGYQTGAGECVSLAALYAAALFIVLDVPLENIFMMATPLHSQNFIVQKEGVLTNNRRLITKTMWFNGSELSGKARRALEHERITIVSHISGYVHIDYPEATINPEDYSCFVEKLKSFLTAKLDFETFINFLRVHDNYRKYFQFEYNTDQRRYYIKAEKLFRYEHGSKNRIGDASRKKLLAEVETDEFDLESDNNRVILNLLEKGLNGRPLFCKNTELKNYLEQELSVIPELDLILENLCGFLHVEPKLPAADKNFLQEKQPDIKPGMSRQEIINVLKAIHQHSQTANLAFYAHRHLDEQGWDPFIKACLERNPVSIEYFKKQSDEEVIQTLNTWANESIYDEQSLATPDEVTNYQRGDGLEKAICLANILQQRHPEATLHLECQDGQAALKKNDHEIVFTSNKGYALRRKL